MLIYREGVKRNGQVCNGTASQPIPQVGSSLSNMAHIEAHLPRHSSVWLAACAMAKQIKALAQQRGWLLAAVLRRRRTTEQGRICNGGTNPPPFRLDAF